MQRLVLATLQSYVHGSYLATTTGKTFANLCPFTGHEICQVEIADADLLDRAVLSSKEAQAVWSGMEAVERSRILLKAASILREKNNDLAELEVWDTGKPIAEARLVDIASGAEAIEYFAQIAVGLEGEMRSTHNAFSYTQRVPLGVCGAIGAWNYPLQIACWKSAAALAVGNSVIFKPSELTPLSALKLAEIYSEAGVPDGVFNVVQGGASTGALLSAHKGVVKISMTGEVGTGRKVMAQAASTLKHVSMELGGKSPILVFADADLNEAVSGAMLGNFYTQGEICSNGTRIFVEKSIYHDFITLFKERTEKLVLGNPLNEATQVGALISEKHAEKVRSYIASGQESGATLVTGAISPEFDPSSDLRSKAYVTPTIFADCQDNMSIVQDEIFGPVASVLSFSDEKEVIARANHCEFGLAAGVFTQNIKRAHRVAEQLDAGVTWINNYNITPNGMPFGGVKQSGIGRENAASTLLEYTQEKSIYVELGSIDCPYK